MNKPTIPNEVADAIEFFREGKDGGIIHTNAQIAEYALNELEYVSSGMVGIYARALYVFDFDTLMAALVNGYERELTEEQRKQKIREVYRDLEECNSLYDVGIRRGIRTILAILGIQIEGVNA